MRRIQLTNGGFALVDDSDFKAVSKYDWYDKAGYAVTKQINGKNVMMHRLIINAPDGIGVDHRFGDGLNNQRYNLRIANQSQNSKNLSKTKKRKTSSIYKGVYKIREQTLSGEKIVWAAMIGGSKAPNRWIGRFKTEEDAARAYDLEALKRFGEFARPNFPQQQAA